MIEVMVDSNFLLYVVRHHIDMISELEELLGRRVQPILITPVKEELESIASEHGNKSSSRDVCQALEIARKLRLEVVTRSPEETVDDLLTRIASERGWIVATNDRRLRKALDFNAIPTIYFRQKTRLEVKGLAV